MTASVRRHTPPDVDVERLAEALGRFTRSTRRDLALPLGASSIGALVTIEQQGPIRLGDLARHEGVTPATLSRIAAVLEEDGYAQRTADVDDRRAAWLAITPAGRRLLDGVRRDRAALLSERLDRLTAEQRATLTRALDAIEALAD